MNIKEFNKYLSERYEKEIKWYNDKSESNQLWHRVLNVYVVVASVTVPVLLSILDTSQSWVKIIISITSASIAITSGINNLFKFQENWINYRTTCETLKKEKSYYLGGVDDYAITKDKEALFIERVESIISRENSLWLTSQKIEKDNKK